MITATWQRTGNRRSTNWGHRNGDAATVRIQECQVVTASDGGPRLPQTKKHAEATGSHCAGGSTGGGGNPT